MNSKSDDFMERIGCNPVTKQLRKDLVALKEAVIEQVYRPKVRREILDYLKANPNVESRVFNDVGWKSPDRFQAITWMQEQEALEKEGLIIAESHGKGRNRTWRLAKT